MPRLLLLATLLLLPFIGSGQEKKKGDEEHLITLGVQFKPILANSLLDVGPVFQSNDVFEATFTPTLGYNFGMVVRRGFNKTFSLETGISFTKRNYDLTIKDLGNDQTIPSDLSIIAYEIPTLLLVYVQLGDQVFMNNAAGFAFDFFPSDVKTSGENYAHYSARNEWAQIALLANVGFEYRTPNAGYFYLGGTYHRPVTDIMRSAVSYKKGNIRHNLNLSLPGSYFTVDLRYFFAESD